MSQVPTKGRLSSKHTRHPSVVPSGRASPAGCFPALKRRAILKISLRDKGIGWSPFPARKQPVHERMASTRFRGFGGRHDELGDDDAHLSNAATQKSFRS